MKNIKGISREQLVEKAKEKLLLDINEALEEISPIAVELYSGKCEEYDDIPGFDGYIKISIALLEVLKSYLTDYSDALNNVIAPATEEFPEHTYELDDVDLMYIMENNIINKYLIACIYDPDGNVRPTFDAIRKGALLVCDDRFFHVSVDLYDKYIFKAYLRKKGYIE